jgi:TolB-like protein
MHIRNLIVVLIICSKIFAGSFGSDRRIDSEISRYRFVLISPTNSTRSGGNDELEEQIEDYGFTLLDIKPSEIDSLNQTLVAKWKTVGQNMRAGGLGYSQIIEIELSDVEGNKILYWGSGEYMGAFTRNDIKGAIGEASRGLSEYSGFSQEAYNQRMIVQSSNTPEIALLNSNSPKVNIAVLEFDNTNIPEDHFVILSNRIRGEFINTNRFNVIERAEMNAILKEQGFQQTGCINSECAVEIGQLIGVEQIVAGNLGKVGNLFILSLRIIDVETGQILKQSDNQISGSFEQAITQLVPENISGLVN